MNRRLDPWRTRACSLAIVGMRIPVFGRRENATPGVARIIALKAMIGMKRYQSTSPF
jgi:hypothetical protein